MTCAQYKEGHPAASAEARAHAASCADCRAFAKAWDLLGAAPELAPSKGFFRGIRRKLAPRILRFAAPIAAAAALLLIAVVLRVAPAPVPTVPQATEEERELVENLEILQNYELLRSLEFTTESSSVVSEERK